MTSLVRRFLKTGILFLVVGLGLGGWMLIRRELAGVYPAPYLVSAHTHAILVGFVMQMILGVALWMFPRPAKTDVRYDPRYAEASYWLIASGTAGRVTGELLRASSDSLAWRLLVVTCGLAQIAGILLFCYTMWSRIRPVGSQAREARGEQF